MKNFSGNKYHRQLTGLDGTETTADVYRVLRAFNVTEPDTSHAIKKLLCAGIRDKGSKLQDLSEARDAISAAILYEEQVNGKPLVFKAEVSEQCKADVEAIACMLEGLQKRKGTPC